MSTKTKKLTDKVKKMAKKAENPKTDKDALKQSLLKEVNEKKEAKKMIEGITAILEEFCEKELKGNKNAKG